MESIIELLSNYGPMTLSELILELGRDRRSMESDLNACLTLGTVSEKGFGLYEVLEKVIR